MSKHFVTSIAAAMTLAFAGITLAAPAISKDEYRAGRDRIAAEYKAARASCESLVANAKDICIAEARGRQKVARAELEARNTPSDRTRYNVGLARSEADYAVAKEKCDDKPGDAKYACVKDAKAVQARAKADAKRTKTSGMSKPAQ